MMLNCTLRDREEEAGHEMLLTPGLVALTIRSLPDLGSEPGTTPLSDAELDALAHDVATEFADQPLWVFAYGSLIWKPEFAAVDQLRATAYGWHRSFCLKMTRWRGSPEQPGLMMALERGGRCDGLIYRLPEDDRVEQIRRMLQREIRFHENVRMVRAISVHTHHGKKRVLAFWAGPTGDRIASRLPLEDVAHIVARACGHAGSCAEYLFNTVSHLEQAGIRDQRLWQLQELVAREIEKIHLI